MRWNEVKTEQQAQHPGEPARELHAVKFCRTLTNSQASSVAHSVIAKLVDRFPLNRPGQVIAHPNAVHNRPQCVAWAASTIVDYLCGIASGPNVCFALHMQIVVSDDKPARG